MNDLSKIKLIVSEVDGVLTNGKFVEDELGNILFKSFQSKDFDAINILKRKYTIVFLSKDNRINYNMCRRRNLPFYWGKNDKEKYDKLVEILRKYQCRPDEVLLIASKLSDIKCCQLIPLSICPADAGEYLKSKCWAEFKVNGGEGIFVELVYLLRSLNCFNIV